MAGFDENLVREYFELNGFFVRQLHKYQVHSRKKSAQEQIDLLVLNPAPAPVAERKPGFQIFSNELALITRAVVAVKGWHTSRMTPSMLRSGSKISDFLQADIEAAKEGYFSGLDDEDKSKEPLTHILVLPGLPATEPLRGQTVELLKARGVDAIISFPTILENLLRHVETNLSYQKSDALQMIRLLKLYDMIKPPQLELFSDILSRKK